MKTPTAMAGRAWLSLLVVAWGAQAITTQSLLLREALVLLFGSELSWGIVLFAWLLGVALGATLGGWLAESTVGTRHAAVLLTAILLALGLATCGDLYVFRAARGWLGVGPGEWLPLPRTALAAVVFVSPTSALVGMAFPLACRVDTTRGPGAAAAAGLLPFGYVYALESAGSLIGGAVFTFWAVEHLTPIQTALTCSALTALAAFGLLSNQARRDRRPAALALSVGVAAAALAVFAGTAWNRHLVQLRWGNTAPGYELACEVESKYQNLAIGRRAEQYTLYANGHATADFPDPYTYAPLAHFWLCQHPEPHTVLLLGGGADGLLAEVLREPVGHVDYVEPDSRQIALLSPYLTDADRSALVNPRVTVHPVDARHFVKTQRDRYDLVIARLPEPVSALRARLYTSEFYRELRRAMTPRSLLCLTAAAAPNELPPPSRAYLASLRATLRRHFARVTVSWGDPAQVLAATQADLTTADGAELARRYVSRKVLSERFDPAWFLGATDWLDNDKVLRRSSALDAEPDPLICTDLQPTICLQRLILWEAQTRPPGARGSGSLQRLRSIRLTHVVAALAAAAAATLLVSRLRRGSRAGWSTGAVTCSIGATGLVTMAMSIIWLYALQNLYGYVYQRIGWVIALFMAGLVLGCLLANRERRRGSLLRRLIWIDLLLALLAAGTPGALTGLARLSDAPAALSVIELCISILVMVTGLLGGAAFATGGAVQLATLGRPGAAAGNVAGADHAGACLGALLCGILLVPVFGTVATALLLAGLKLACAGVLMILRPAA